MSDGQLGGELSLFETISPKSDNSISGHQKYMTTQAKIPGIKPVAIELKANKIYHWCRCGRSKNQPFCDGSHRGTPFSPLPFSVEKDERYFLCQCKKTKKPPFCDGSHKRITQEEIDASAGLKATWYHVANPDELHESEVRTVQAGQKTIALTYCQGHYAALDNACPHQGGPLGEGTIECHDSQDCWLRCPWHGSDFHPTTGTPPGEFDASVSTYPLEEREDGIYVQIKERMVRQRTVSDVMVETMVNWCVRRVFGRVGHSNLGLADAIREEEDNGHLKFIGIRHEAAAALACSGYAKLSSYPAACLATAGASATNLLTGLWDAKADRTPVLALTGQVNTQTSNPGAFQGIDLADAFSAVSGFSQTVRPNSQHAELMSQALKHAHVHRTVSHLIFPDAVQTIAVDDHEEPSTPDGRLGMLQIIPPDEAIEQALEQIIIADRPVIIVGYGAKQRMVEIITLAERLNSPILTTFKAKGQVPDSHPLATGVLGRSGTPISSWFMNKADLLIVFGASFSHHTGINARKTIIQVDLDRMMLGKAHPVEVPVWAEIGIAAQRFIEEIPHNISTEDPRKEIASRWKIWRQKKQQRAQQNHQGLNPARIFAELAAVCPANAIIAIDVDHNTDSFGQYFECKSQHILMSGYLGTIGFAFPAAMGAWAATEDFSEFNHHPVISISGDDGFSQYLAEFTTAVKYGMNITHILLRNEEQAARQTSRHNPDFSEFANHCGGRGIRIKHAEQLQAGFKRAFDNDGPTLVELICDRELI